MRSRRIDCRVNTIRNRTRRALLLAAAAAPMLAWPLRGAAQTATWISGVGDVWSNPANWSAPPVSGPVNTLEFTASGSQSYTAIDDFPGRFVLGAGQFGSGTIAFTGSSTGSMTLATGSLSLLRFGFSNRISQSSPGDVYLNGRIDNTNGLSFEIAPGSGNLIVNAVLSGFGPTFLSGGAGSVLLNGQNTFGGTILTLSRRVDFGAQTSLGTDTIYASGGTLGSAMFVSPTGTPPFLPAIST